MATALAAAVLGSGYGAPLVGLIEEDENDPARLKREEAKRIEFEQRQRDYEDRRRLRAERWRDEQDRAAERERMLEAGLDPTNGRPLSRQQRRAQARQRAKGPSA